VATVLLSAVISATLSSASGDLLGAATIYVKDLHPRMAKTALSDAAELTLSRLLVLAVGVVAIVIALASGQIIPLLVFAFTVRSAGPFAAFIFGLLWRRTSRLAGLASIIVGTVVGLWWKIADPAVPVVKSIDAIIPASLAGVAVFLAIHLIDRSRGRLVGDSAGPHATTAHQAVQQTP